MTPWGKITRRKSAKGVVLPEHVLQAMVQLPEITGMGVRNFEPYWANVLHASPGCEFLFVQEGWVRTIFYRRANFTTQPGGFILIPPEMRHRDEFDLARGMQVFMVSFRWPAARAYFRLLPFDACREAPEEVRREIALGVARMQDCLAGGSEADRLLARAELLAMLMLILRAHLRVHDAIPESRASARRQDILKQAREYLDRHYAEEISLEHLADHLRISAFYLSHVFSQENGFSFMEYLINRRMQQAKLLLQSGRPSIKETAYAVGYKDANYFSKVFHRFFGFTPRELQMAAARRAGRAP